MEGGGGVVRGIRASDGGFLGRTVGDAASRSAGTAGRAPVERRKMERPHLVNRWSSAGIHGGGELGLDPWRWRARPLSMVAGSRRVFTGTDWRWRRRCREEGGVEGQRGGRR